MLCLFELFYGANLYTMGPVRTRIYRRQATILVLVRPPQVMEDHLVELYINVFRSQLIDLLLEPSLFENVHLLVQKLLDLQDEFNAFVNWIEVTD